MTVILLRSLFIVVSNTFFISFHLARIRRATGRKIKDHEHATIKQIEKAETLFQNCKYKKIQGLNTV